MSFFNALFYIIYIQMEKNNNEREVAPSSPKIYVFEDRVSWPISMKNTNNYTIVETNSERSDASTYSKKIVMSYLQFKHLMTKLFGKCDIDFDIQDQELSFYNEEYDSQTDFYPAIAEYFGVERIRWIGGRGVFDCDSFCDVIEVYICVEDRSTSGTIIPSIDTYLIAYKCYDVARNSNREYYLDFCPNVFYNKDDADRALREIIRNEYNSIIERSVNETMADCEAKKKMYEMRDDGVYKNGKPLTIYFFQKVAIHPPEYYS